LNKLNKNIYDTQQIIDNLEVQIRNVQMAIPNESSTDSDPIEVEVEPISSD
jgi:hypothetical protein